MGLVGEAAVRVRPDTAAFGALTAAAAGLAPLRPPAAWFENPQLAGPTALTITEEGRVYGHAALWGTCHTGYPGQCVEPPKGGSYQNFLLGAILTAEGDEIPCGQITLDTNHADLSMGAEQAAAHYDRTGTAIADVSAGEDRHGIWFAGALRPTADANQVRALRAAKLSGDWREAPRASPIFKKLRGALELIGLLTVNIPGFPVPRTRVRVASGVTDGEPRLALIASGVAVPPDPRVAQAEIEVAAAMFEDDPAAALCDLIAV